MEKRVLPFLANSSSEQQLSLSKKTVEVSDDQCENSSFIFFFFRHFLGLIYH